MSPLLGQIAQLAAWSCLLVGLLPALYLVILSLLAWPPSRRPKTSVGALPAIAVVVPAHNESLMIGATVRGLLAQNYPKASFKVLVIADNCSDDTAALARSAGAAVLERHQDPGKGQALRQAFDLLLREPWQALLVVDADSQLHPDTLTELGHALNLGAEALQIRYAVANPSESWRTAAMELALASFNALRPLGRNRLGCSAGLFGNGFCLSRRSLERVPYGANSIVEDLEYHSLLMRAGLSVRFLEHVWVKAQMPATAAASRSQRVRWERGRFALIASLLPGLLADLLRGRRSALETLIDLCLPPVSTIGLCLLPALALPGLPRLLAGLGLGLLALHYAVAALRFGHLGRSLRVAVHIPWYVIWKTWAVLSSLLRQRNLPWIRTQRH